jgi:hypothetical protein
MATQKPAKPVLLKSNRFVETPSFRKNQGESFLKIQINSDEKSSRQKSEYQKLRIKKSVHNRINPKIVKNQINKRNSKNHPSS